MYSEKIIDRDKHVGGGARCISCYSRRVVKSICTFWPFRVSTYCGVVLREYRYSIIRKTRGFIIMYIVKL